MNEEPDNTMKNPPAPLPVRAAPHNGGPPGPGLERARVRVEWTELGEGYDSEWDPEDPDDIQLLRFDFYGRLNHEWLVVSKASYCTNVPASTNPTTRTRLLARLLAEGCTTIEHGLDQLISEHGGDANAAREVTEVTPASSGVFELLSHIAPDWLNRPNALHECDPLR
jgi:hypothetical protein